LDETRNIDLTIEKENRKLRSRKIKRSVQSEWRRNKKLNCYEIQDTKYRTFKTGTEMPERKIGPPCGAACRLAYSYFPKFFEQGEVDIFKRYLSLGVISAQRIPSLNVLMSYQARLESLRRCFRMCI
jgi:hypothetical protein